MKWPWGRVVRVDREPMPWKYEELASYNTRVSQGVVHTPEYQQRMAILQAEFNEIGGARTGI